MITLNSRDCAEMTYVGENESSPFQATTMATKPKLGQSAQPTPIPADLPQSGSNRSHKEAGWANITALAATSTTPSQFLKAVAVELSQRFPVKLVAMSHSDWQSPLLLSSNADDAEPFSATLLSRLFDATTQSPTTCHIPRGDMTGMVDNRERGLCVRLLDAPDVCGIVMVYHDGAVPDAVGQIKHLRQLSDLANQCRAALSGYGVAGRSANGLNPTMRSGTDQALRHFHRDLDVKATCFRIANETRRLMAVERVSVLVERRGKLTVQAVSGVAVVDRRSNSVKAAECLAARAAVLGCPVVLPNAETQPPQIATALDEYLDQSDVTSVAVLPLFEQKSKRDDAELDVSIESPTDRTHEPTTAAIGLILLESFSRELEQATLQQATEVTAAATSAIQNAREHQRIFALPLMKLLGDWFGGRKLKYSILLLVVSCGILVASTVVKVDHRIIASGFAEPVAQRHVFARNNGVVTEILVIDGQTVKAGQPLLRLENADLETRVESVTGEIQTSTKRLASIGSMLLDPGTDSKQASRLAIEKRQLESELESLKSELELVRSQISHLEIVAPMEGVVAAWQLNQKLADRPIARGDVLMTIVQDTGPWQLKLEIADEDSAEIIREFNQNGSLDVEFAAASNPSETFQAVLNSLSTVTRKTATGDNVLDAVATIDMPLDANSHGVGQAELAKQAGTNRRWFHREMRSGIETTAKIRCGRRSALSSWFGDVADFVHRNLLFYLR